MSTVQCPTCKRSFNSERNMRIHFTRMHNKRRAPAPPKGTHKRPKDDE